MYEDFLKKVLLVVQALNRVETETKDLSEDLTPYVNLVPVIFMDELVGFVVDEIGAGYDTGGGYSYRDATAAEKEWWASWPKLGR